MPTHAYPWVYISERQNAELRSPPDAHAWRQVVLPESAGIHLQVLDRGQRLT